MFPSIEDRPSRALAAPQQRRFDDLEIPLHEVTFCAVDLETTSVSPKDGEIIEIGAVKATGGQRVGTFQTFVGPSQDPPVEIQVLTGITPRMLAGAEPLPAVLPAFLEFLGPAVFVAHNARFDHSFITAACRRLDYDPPTNEIVDTARLARRLLRHETRSVALQRLAAHLRVETTPCHRAFPDAAACLEVLYVLIERGAAYGVTTLADLLEIQRVRSNPHFEKVKLARGLPRRRGVYLFRNARREIVYVGKAADLRARVRSYFTSDERKRMGDLRAEADSVHVIECATEPEAAGLEARLIEEHQPRYNRAGRRRTAPVYLKLTAERHPRFSVVRKLPPASSDAVVLGPFASRKRAQRAATMLAGLFAVRTCTLRLGGVGVAPCALYDLGSCHGPCTGRAADVAAHDGAVRDLRLDLHRGLHQARERLAHKLTSLAEQGRFEEAASHRDAFIDLVRTLERVRRLQALRAAGRVELQTPDGPLRLSAGRLADDDRTAPGPPPSRGSARLRPGVLPPGPPEETSLSLHPDGLGERGAISSWLDRAQGIRLTRADAPLAYPWPRAEALERIGSSDDRTQVRHRAEGPGVQ